MPQTVTGAYTAAKVHAEGTYFDPCKLRTHSAGCPSPLTPHHCVPDHCWKANASDDSRFNITGATPPTMTTGSGLCICVDGTGKHSDSTTGDKHDEILNRHSNKVTDLATSGNKKSDSENLARTFRTESQGHQGGTTTLTAHAGNELSYFNNLGKHGKIHHIFDAAENSLAQKNETTLGTNAATLGQLERLASRTIERITGCSAKNIFQQLRNFHQERGIKSNTILRANSKNGGTSSAPLGNQTANNSSELRHNLQAQLDETSGVMTGLGIP